jgi:hypothetical protein
MEHPVEKVADSSDEGKRKDPLKCRTDKNKYLLKIKEPKLPIVYCKYSTTSFRFQSTGTHGYNTIIYKAGSPYQGYRDTAIYHDWTVIIIIVCELVGKFVQTDLRADFLLVNMLHSSYTISSLVERPMNQPLVRGSAQVGPRRNSSVFHFSLATPICPSRFVQEL